MPACYLAGPMRGIPAWNFPEFFRAEMLLNAWGWDVRNPAAHDVREGVNVADYPILPDWFTLEGALTWDFTQIIETKNIVLLSGWETSEGAAKELRVAEDVGAKVWTLHGDVMRQSSWDAVHRLQEVTNWQRRPRPDVAITSKGFHDTGDITGVQWTTDPRPDEVRITDPLTGGQKGQKSARTDLLPYDALLELAEHYGRGATKYEDRNWERGYKWSLSAAAMQRHFMAWWNGEELDEDGFPHATAFAWHALALLTFSLREIGTDDRPSLGRGVSTGDESPSS